ncbi:MAG: tRNA uridine(34) 5-carboxymethylaminomethyl modification radical SAM/GNAT enzyme Elp3 [Thaumarchaeota archaeon]|nr:tRNA uridine(34) 5-carboxymethylaminomethyl modification radical SAM/GNAT enzyme Elp3 [Nitrososphaerota archaeon]
MLAQSNVSEDERMLMACREIAGTLVERKVSKVEFESIRKNACIKYSLSRMPGNAAILEQVPSEDKERVRSVLMVKPTRTASGVAVIAIMTRPHPCPHGVCVYCPGGVRNNSPQAYTGHEPAALRGKQNDYDSARQVYSRLRQLKSAGHKLSKAELIIMGGTFLSTPPDYQRGFVKGALDALNGIESSSLEEAKLVAETAATRNVGITVETRPDWCRQKHVDNMLSYGATRVEIGVQVLDDEIYRIMRRGHTVADVVESFQIAKDSAYKIVAHMMPGLPGSTPEKDIQSIRQLFEDERFRPDMLKIYPTLLIASADLYQWWLEGRYKPYGVEDMVQIIAEAKKYIPKWVRIMRIQRDIPAKMIVDGVKKSNLRELVLEELKRRGYSCRCIRCREIGLKQIKEKITFRPDDIAMNRTNYDASEGKEIFLSFDDKSADALVGFLRLRVPSEKAHRSEIAGQRALLVRELHIYGPVVPVGEKEDFSWQHKGFGRALMEEAERIAVEEFDTQKMVVISALGTREYYRKLGYKSDGPYVSKVL